MTLPTYFTPWALEACARYCAQEAARGCACGYDPTPDACDWVTLARNIEREPTADDRERFLAAYRVEYTRAYNVQHGTGYTL